MKTSSGSHQVFLINVYSVNCNIGVPEGGSDLKISPVRYLGHFSQCKLINEILHILKFHAKSSESGV